jgi:SNF2 family DNA or RNA helicase
MAIDLFEFQKEDVDKLHEQKSALIANEMGTGKTYEAIARDLRLRAEGKINGPTLVIAPLSVLPSWRTHFRNLSRLSVYAVDNKRRDQSFRLFRRLNGDVLLIHWEGVRLMGDLLKEVEWGHIIADECHRVQNRHTRWVQALKSLKSEYKTGLSGTPITNTPDKMWSVLNWLHPTGTGEDKTRGYYTSYWAFRGKFCEQADVRGPGGKTIKVVGAPKNTDLLHEMVDPYFVRHLKKGKCCEHHPDGVLSELPDKVYSQLWVDLLPQQRRAYDDMRRDMVAWVGKHEHEPLAASIVVAQLMRLQQFACAFAEFDEQGKMHLSEPSSKIDALMQLLDDNPDEQFVVFSQFASLIRMLNERLKKKGISGVTITGDVPGKLRGGLVDKFQSGEKRCFTGTIAAGGEGITLTAASTVAFLDRSWNPAMNSQAEDRLHRIGQKDTVNVIDIMATNTVDLGKKQRLEAKWEWIREVLGDEPPQQKEID